MPDATEHASAPIVTDELLLSKCRYFADVHIWPRIRRLDPQAWLSNFLPAEQPYALHLLNSFIFFSNELVERLFVAAFQRLSQNIVQNKKSFLTARGEWRRFVSAAAIVGVTGELPSDADSGFIFSRLARNSLGISEENLLRPDAALAELVQNPATPIVFVDDFVGSGNQFAELWDRSYQLGKHGPLSFRTFASAVRTRTFYYCPLICTSYAHSRLATYCPQVVLHAAHVLDERYSALHPDSLLWPPDLRPGAEGFLRNASTRAGIPDQNGTVGDWRGFHKLALALAFEHGTPDATLPLFTWSQNNWRPLIRPL